MTLLLLLLIVWPVFYTRYLLPARAAKSDDLEPVSQSPTNWPASNLILCARDERELLHEGTLNNIRELAQIPNLRILIALESHDALAVQADTSLSDLLVIHTNASKNRSIEIALEVLMPKDEDLIVLTDANTKIPKDALITFLGWFLERPHLGASGAPICYLPDNCPENRHLQKENRIRLHQSRWGWPMGLSGGMMVVRARYFTPVPEEFPLDMGLPLALACAGVPVKMAPSPSFYEPMPAIDTVARRRRTISRGIWCVLHFLTLMWKQRRLDLLFHLLSHKALRFLWAFTLPSFCLAIVIETSLSLWWMMLPFPAFAFCYGQPQARHMSEACLGLYLAWFDVLRGRKIRTWPCGH